MKLNFFLTGWSAWRSIAMCLTGSAIITVCSSCTGDTGSFTSAGVGTGGTGSLQASISGKVADGYLANATVFMDKGTQLDPPNYQLDPGEPFAMTEANGDYVLNVDSADLGKYPIVAHAIQGVTKDTGVVLTSSYVLSLHKDSVNKSPGNNFISPLTSQLREMMETGIYTNMQQAADALRTKMGLSSTTDMMADYIAVSNTDMHTAAQNIATLMGNQMEQVLGTSGSATTVDVNRYRKMMGTIFSNIPTVMGVNNQAGMSNLNNTMTTMLSTNMPRMSAGQPYQNMSTAFRGMMGK